MILSIESPFIPFGETSNAVLPAPSLPRILNGKPERKEREREVGKKAKREERKGKEEEKSKEKKYLVTAGKEKGSRGEEDRRGEEYRRRPGKMPYMMQPVQPVQPS
ncbi:hypothetical protein K435DRAFT_797157 [Dendrothele bispora CBS 962.96]|uniref:Uncharacterized protein n=1 Tax=Dendrothele bispora (strain CBS 962.96) TaxID=1314807 RepID=A0A4S8M3F6_DENBC|nr:hypothetical protein K435DRAFT_797157 [Dendrothele bispora CBS 962.96]